MYGFESRMPVQPFYISSDNGNGCFAARVRGLIRKAHTANSINRIVKWLRRCSSKAKLLVRFQLHKLSALVCSILLNGQEVALSRLKYGFKPRIEYQLVLASIISALGAPALRAE